MLILLYSTYSQGSARQNKKPRCHAHGINHIPQSGLLVDLSTKQLPQPAAFAPLGPPFVFLFQPARAARVAYTHESGNYDHLCKWLCIFQKLFLSLVILSLPPLAVWPCRFTQQLHRRFIMNDQPAIVGTGYFPVLGVVLPLTKDNQIAFAESRLQILDRSQVADAQSSENSIWVHL
ncbi:hypothetical protein BJY01DRAFT_132533 [Aspergillus pseudoustus]|uniref:Uncharacterized protein n=1 Tax=Aspergillus pseudoustus TaxID=1810923 RepID=A0ABR4KDH3_9EURO